MVTVVFVSVCLCVCVSVCVCCVCRLLRLLSGGEMSHERLQYVVLDLAADAKQRSLLDMKEVREDVVNLHTQLFSPLLNAGTLKIALM